jgi:class 3 adenylate cyclase/HAMP domain-containing protein
MQWALSIAQSLVVKNVLVFIVIVIAVVTPIAYTYLRSVEQLLTDTLAAQVAVAAQRGSALVDVASLPALVESGDANDSAYRALRRLLARIQDEFQVDNAVVIRRLDSGRYAYIADGSGQFALNEDVRLYDSFPETRPAAEEAWRSGQIGKTRLFSTADSKWFQINVPLLQDGKVQALLLINKFATPVAEEIGRRQRWIVLGVSAALLLGIGVWGYFTHRVMRPLVALRRAAAEISAGNLEVAIAPYRARNEVGDLTRSFERMVADLRSSRDLLQQEKDSFFRFVPTQFLQLLGRRSATEIQLGDSTLRSMSVMFSDIRSFTSVSESLEAAAVFGFLNEYLARMEPAIQSQGGFVDKFLGDGVMALFADEEPGAVTASDLAVNAAVAMRRELTELNRLRRETNLPDVRIGIGIHTGPVVLGTVGSTARLNTTVIGDTVNLASRLEGLTDRYGADLVISEGVYWGLSNRKVHSLREIAWVRVKGKAKPVTLVEVFDWEQPADRALKTETRSQFAQGLSLYRKGRFAEALHAFEQVAQRSPGDRVALRYVELCERYARRPPPGPWRGIDVLLSK